MSLHDALNALIVFVAVGSSHLSAFQWGKRSAWNDAVDIGERVAKRLQERGIKISDEQKEALIKRFDEEGISPKDRLR